jgi:hypothetical protein
VLSVSTLSVTTACSPIFELTMRQYGPISACGPIFERLPIVVPGRIVVSGAISRSGSRYVVDGSTIVTPAHM